MSAGLFLLAGGRDDWQPRDPVLGCLPRRANPAGGGGPPIKNPMVLCEGVDCDVEFRKRSASHTTCSFTCANSLRRRVRGS